VDAFAEAGRDGDYEITEITVTVHLISKGQVSCARAAPQLWR